MDCVELVFSDPAATSFVVKLKPNFRSQFHGRLANISPMSYIAFAIGCPSSVLQIWNGIEAGRIFRDFDFLQHVHHFPESAMYLELFFATCGWSGRLLEASSLRILSKLIHSQTRWRMEDAKYQIDMIHQEFLGVPSQFSQTQQAVDIVIGLLRKSWTRMAIEPATSKLLQALFKFASPVKQIELIEVFYTDLVAVAVHPCGNYVVNSLLRGMSKRISNSVRRSSAMDQQFRTWLDCFWQKLMFDMSVFHFVATNPHGSFCTKALVQIANQKQLSQLHGQLKSSNLLFTLLDNSHAKYTLTCLSQRMKHTFDRRGKRLVQPIPKVQTFHSQMLRKCKERWMLLKNS